MFLFSDMWNVEGDKLVARKKNSLHDLLENKNIQASFTLAVLYTDTLWNDLSFWLWKILSVLV